MFDLIDLVTKLICTTFWVVAALAILAELMIIIIGFAGGLRALFFVLERKLRTVTMSSVALIAFSLLSGIAYAFDRFR